MSARHLPLQGESGKRAEAGVVALAGKGLIRLQLRTPLHPRGELRDEQGRRPYAHPFFWAGFVLIGEAG
jgi:CHAT domain-containing protein